VDEDGSESDGGSSSQFSLVSSDLSRLVGGEVFLSDLLSNLSSDSLQLLNSSGLVVFDFDDNLVDSDDGVAGSGVLDLAHDFLGGVSSDLSDELSLDFLEGLLDHFLGLNSDVLFSFL
jgi:hypothetical protein